MLKKSTCYLKSLITFTGYDRSLINLYWYVRCNIYFTFIFLNKCGVPNFQYKIAKDNDKEWKGTLYQTLCFSSLFVFTLFFFKKKKKKKKKNLNPSILWTGRRVKPNWLESNHDPTWGKGVVVETPDSPEYYRLPTWDNCPAELLLVLAPSQCRCTVMYISSKAKKTSWLSLLPRSDS
jgi:hypothetical protein